MPNIDDATTPMLRQYLRIKADHPGSILMFRMGDFYEMFFEDAQLASQVLDITLTARNRNDPNPVPLCGVPYHSVEPYIAKLLESGHKVAVCDQVEDAKFATGVVKRAVTRVITPGVVVDGLGLDAKANNFLAALCIRDGRIGMAIVDASTGLFQAAEFSDRGRIFEELSRIEPREILVDAEFSGDKVFRERIKLCIPNVIFTDAPDEGSIASANDAPRGKPLGDREEGEHCHPLPIPLPSRERECAVTPPRAAGNYLVENLEGAREVVSQRPAAAAAARAIFSYIEATQKGRVIHLRTLASLAGDRAMRLDESTKRNLELVKTMRDSSQRGSLLFAMDKTMTAAGGRKLKRWILYPLTDPAEINARLDAVQMIVSETDFLRHLPGTLSNIADLERIATRAATGLANARDLAGLKSSLVSVAILKKQLDRTTDMLASLRSAIDPREELASAIGETLVDDPPFSVRDGGLVKAGVSPELDEFRDIIAHGKDFIASLESKERAATGISSLKIRYNKVFGYYMEVTHTHREKVPDYYIRKQTLANAERYITPELKEYEEKILGAEEKMRALEYEIFTSLRDKVAASLAGLLKTADAIASVDCIVSFARVAAEYNYVRPLVNGTDIIDIRDGRHPIVERINPLERFVPNDVLLDDADSKIMMITGPNMAGKSTVMRQTALIVLMAQIGSFVPARSAEIGVVDRIFTRVGASDALAQGQSTFMVEMSEAAVILKEATRKSLIIIDEIGRGTSTFDGLAIAWGVAEDIHDRVNARTMFATHYHELTDLALTKPGIRNMNIAVKEWNGEVIFLRKLVAGATSRSYGIQVAKLAGLPNGVIERAREVLENLESGELDEVGKPRLASRATKGAKSEPAQYQLFSAPLPREVSTRLSEIDTSVITPIEALNILHELKGKI